MNQTAVDPKGNALRVPKTCSGQGQNLALAGLFVPNSLDRGPPSPLRPPRPCQKWLQLFLTFAVFSGKWSYK